MSSDRDQTQNPAIISLIQKQFLPKLVTLKYIHPNNISLRNVNSHNNYQPELVVAIPRDANGNSKTFLRALVDSGSNKTHSNIEKIPKWLLEQSISGPNQTPFSGWGSEFTSDRIVHLPLILTQFSPTRKIVHQVHLSKTKHHDRIAHVPDMIIGRDIIKNLGLTLNFQALTPIVEWDDIMVPMVTRGFWKRQRLNLTFLQQSKTTLEKAEERFESHSPSMIAAGYQKTNLRN
jgi:hypothetical protein